MHSDNPLRFSSLSRKSSRVFTCLAASCLLASCTSTKNLALETTFPVPLVNKVPVTLGVHLDEELLGYVYTEEIEKKGEWNVDVGAVQTELFDNLATGLFEGHQIISADVAPGLDGILKPKIEELQFSLPSQTRSNFYEVWIRYNFKLYDSNGNPIGDWPLPAYGKASNEDFSSSSSGVKAAAIAACRDAMAFFVLNFNKVPAVQQWLAAGKPQRPPAPPVETGEAAGPEDPGTAEKTATEASENEETNS